jgi:hypothetical protein
MFDYLALFNQIGLISDISIVCPVVLAIFYRNNVTFSIENKLLYLLVIVLFLKTVSTLVITNIYHLRNIFLYNWFGQISSLVVAAIYFNWFQSKRVRYAIVAGSVISLLLALQKPSTFLDLKTDELNSFSIAVWGIGILIAVLSFFYSLIKQLDAPQLLRYPMFWLSAGLLLYFSATFFSYIYSELTFNNNDHKYRLPFWIIEMVFGFVLNCFLTLAIWNTKWPKEIN